MKFAMLGVLSALLLAMAAPGLTEAVKLPRFRVLIVASQAKDHLKMIAAAQPFFERLGAQNNLTIVFTSDATSINDKDLKQYKVLVMLHMAPFDLTYDQQAAVQKFVEEGHGWVGIHAAGLTGKEFIAPETKYWQWFEDFMGNVLYSPHPHYQTGTLVIEDHKHPATHHLPQAIQMGDEWYEWNKSVRGQPGIRVLATADESSYHPNKPMGDHPMIWTNEKFRRMIYISVGHDPSALDNPNYAILLRDSILWAGS